MDTRIYQILVQGPLKDIWQTRGGPDLPRVAVVTSGLTRRTAELTN